MLRAIFASKYGIVASSILLAAPVALHAETVTFSIDPGRSSLTAEADLVDLGDSPLVAVANGTYEVDGFTATVTLPVDARSGEGDGIEVTFLGDLAATAQFGQLVDGDYNNSGVVEQADLDLVLLNWGQPAAPPPSGWVSDPPVGTVDQEELDGVLLNWGNQAPALAPAESVPEPYSLLLLLLAPTPLILRRRW